MDSADTEADGAAPFETDPLDAARGVLTRAVETAQALGHLIDQPAFSAALNLLQQAGGRVVVTGMGQSGHVARKVAATLASTGTPALFLHPAEASHGDMGMITTQDVVVALSNSGETAELEDVVAFARRYHIPLIGMTRRPGSTLALAADVALLLPPTPEACPLGLAPTTSTTAMLILGDALAVALLTLRGFTPQQFRVLHPGGALGRRLLRVADLMRSGDALPLVPPDMAMSEVLVVMTAKSLGCVAVVAQDRLVGIISDGDLRRHMAPDLLTRSAGSVMTAGPVTIRPAALAAEALGLMNKRAIKMLFVVEDDRPVGYIDVYDCLRAGIG
jgi:arabinose-5-phosphate isomerase